MDWWATKPTLTMAAKEKTRILLVLNRLPSRGKLVECIRAEIATANLPLAQAGFGNRSAFAASMMEGRGVIETQPKGAAADEVRALAAEIETLLAGG
jgi:chromosome partitioning protein